jgi:beta-glucosidase
MFQKPRHIFPFLFVLILTAHSYLASQAQPSTSEIEARVDSMLKKLTLEEKIDLIGGQDDFYIRAVPKIGLPRLRMADGPVGVRNYGPSTVFGGIGLAATWDTELAKRIGETIGRDARARGVHFMLGPGVNIYRAPRNGRNFEYFGEDPYLASRIAVNYINGMQAQGVSATIKHFMGNNSEFDRHNTDSIIDERTMREIYLPVFEAAVKEAHVGSIMDSYNLTNGEHMTENHYFNTDVVKKDWGFSGILMSDWDATYNVVAAANSGLDLEMPSGKIMNRASLIPAIKAGKVSEETINDKVRRILRTAIQFGWLDRDQTDASLSLLNPEGDRTALEAARSGMVLLKNEGNALPLVKANIKTIAIIGPDAHPTPTAGGGSAEAKPFSAVSYLQGIEKYLAGNAKVYYSPGIPTLDEMAKQTNFTTEANGGKTGLKTEFFNNVDLKRPRSILRYDKHVHYIPAQGSDGSDTPVSIRWSGYFTADSAGEYLAFAQGPGENGGYRLYIDKKLVIDDWTQWYAFVNQVPVTLTAGSHEVEFDYRANGGWGKTTANLGIVRPENLVSAEAKAMASHADAVIIAAGFNADSEGESGDRLFRLPPAQDELINQIAALNKNAVVVMTSGGGVDMSSWIDHVPALLEAWYPGQEGGDALAQILFGDFDPSGRLPISIERRWEDNAAHDSYYPNPGSKKVEYKEGLFIGYRHFDKNKDSVKPLFPFGYGLSYTRFSYSNLKLSAASADEVSVAFDVTNTGARAGVDTAEVFVGDRHAPVPRPVKELKGFAKVNLNPGETKHVTIKLDRRAFSYYDVAKKSWAVAPGDFDIFVARSAADIQLPGKISMQ